MNSIMPYTLLLTCLAFIAGCGDTTASDPKDRSSSDKKANVKLVAKTWDETQNLVAVYKGKVVVIDLWSIFWAECIDQLPGLVQLHKKHKNNVACITFAMDVPDDRESVLNKLRELGANFDNVLCGGDVVETYDQINLAAVPAIYVYDQNGKLAKRFDNEEEEYPDGFTYDKHIAPFVENLLKNPPAKP